MNKSLAILIANDNARLIECVFTDAAGKNPSVYVYKTLDSTIKKDDLVIVQVKRNTGYSICKVQGEASNIDPTVDNGIEYGWIVRRFDDTEFKAMLEQEQQIIKTMLNAQLRKKRREIRAEIMDGDEELKSLPLVEMGPVAIEAAPKPKA